RAAKELRTSASIRLHHAAFRNRRADCQPRRRVWRPRSRTRLGLKDPSPQSYFLEKILERELHNSRIPRRRDFPEKVAIEIECGVHHDDVVENVERLRSKFHLLHFTHRECSREGKIELP